MTDRAAPVLDRLDDQMPAALERLSELLRIPSISTDPAYADACTAAADWMVADLASMGLDASRRDTPGRPMVVAHADGPPGGEGPHLLFYGHYDVQPVDPLDLWRRDPFDPVVEDGAIRARGASDDKGQLMTFVEALRAWIAVHGAPPCRLTILLEGEEESGSPSLVPFLRENAAELRADLALICDTGLYDDRVPAIATSLRGLLGEEIVIHGANRDLHSGSYGGIAMNPIRVLTRILGGLHDAEGRVRVPGFYDGVPELEPERKKAWQDLGFAAEAFLGEVGLADPAGERGRMPLEMIWSRPTAEINGILGGYTGAGFKTVLPAQASAKVSFRLVAGQDPHRLRESFRDWVMAQIPADCRVEFHGHGASPASAMDTSHPLFDAAREALSEEWGDAAVFTGMGGSIPIAGHFREELGMESMLAGWAKDDDRIHSPNEKYDLDSFHKGMRSWARVLARV
ncbi:M20/M25/M40 family metallo-hydrolase [Jannaschia sp. Os4]|uniref:M20/M25/M40 family metallo-hydrolase n=1 Tax=Jannaschia sp. Os4 TaxID=2807617 RepID=UPI0019397F2E|nr:M20/M25/M40 family metallo-hydrolase [Jannaschia sp. Os4]MBM2577915.1 M20/M25/M40 family metallo-hydrolase [Jannaschia sp. Os4]